MWWIYFYNSDNKGASIRSHVKWKTHYLLQEMSGIPNEEVRKCIHQKLNNYNTIKKTDGSSQDTTLWVNKFLVIEITITSLVISR